MTKLHMSASEALHAITMRNVLHSLKTRSPAWLFYSVKADRKNFY